MLSLYYKKIPDKITMYLNLNTIIKLKFTTSFDRYAMLNVPNCFNKNVEP